MGIPLDLTHDYQYSEPSERHYAMKITYNMCTFIKEISRSFTRNPHPNWTLRTSEMINEQINCTKQFSIELRDPSFYFALYSTIDNTDSK